MVTETPLKMMKNFTLKSSFRSQDIQVFVMTFWSCKKNGSIRKIRLISKSMTSQPGNQAMKFGQLIEYKMRIIFVEKSYTKCAGKTIPRPLSKKSKLSIYLDQ